MKTASEGLKVPSLLLLHCTVRLQRLASFFKQQIFYANEFKIEGQIEGQKQTAL